MADLDGMWLDRCLCRTLCSVLTDSVQWYCKQNTCVSYSTQKIYCTVAVHKKYKAMWYCKIWYLKDFKPSGSSLWIIEKKASWIKKERLQLSSRIFFLPLQKILIACSRAVFNVDWTLGKRMPWASAYAMSLCQIY